ncbi:MAG TPA: phosphatidylglycerophosphatase A [Holophagaceae bacterium]|nr:phosphatidylglycerophosphatase A [Holophagaceae bacterium]
MSSATPGPTAPRWAWWVATGFGSGYLRPAPGTWGSLAAVAVWFSVTRLAEIGASTAWAEAVYFSQWAVLPVGITWGAIRASTLVGRETGLKDPSFIVADEWAGVWIALIPLALHIPATPIPLSWQFARLLTPFLLFRLFDIWKPWPVDQLQAFPGGWGIVLDDVMAGVYAAVPTFFADAAILRWLMHR